MDSKRGVSAMGRKVRMMKRPVDTPNTYRHVRTQRKPQPEIPPILINSVELEFATPTSHEDLIDHEIQKRVLTNKVTQLTQECSVEEARRRKLEDDVAQLRARVTETMESNPNTDELRSRLKLGYDQLETVHSHFTDNMEILTEYRLQLDRLRRNRFVTEHRAKRRASERLSEIDGKPITKVAKRAQSSFAPASSTPRQDPEIERLISETGKYHELFDMMLEVLGLHNIPALFAEADRLQDESAELARFLRDNEPLRADLLEEIAGLEKQHERLSVEAELAEEEQRGSIDELALDIRELQGQLRELRTQKLKDEREFAQVYTEIEAIFNGLGCDWGQLNEGGKGITEQNVLAALDLIQTAAARAIAGQSPD
jgi:predicted  nucleic acid-binding Zn-ribbon protein